MIIQILLTTFEAVALLLGIGTIGMLIMGRRIMPEEAMGILSILALEIALPCLVFVNILQHFKPAQFPDWWHMPLWWAGFTVFLACLTAFFSLAARPGNRREFALSLFFQNGLFFPLAILTGMFGKESPFIVQLFLFKLLFPSLFFSTAHLFFQNTALYFDWGKIINKVLLATIAASSIRLLGVEGMVPDFLTSALGKVGDMAPPLLMLILGGNLYIDFTRREKIYALEAGKFVAAKNFLLPLMTLLALLLIRPPYHISLLILLQSAVPPLTAVPILTGRYGGNRELVSQFMFTSFVVSLISIPVIMVLFGFYFQPPE